MYIHKYILRVLSEQRIFRVLKSISTLCDETILDVAHCIWRTEQTVAVSFFRATFSGVGAPVQWVTVKAPHAKV